MTLNTTNPARGGAAGLGNCSLLRGENRTELKFPLSKRQARRDLRLAVSNPRTPAPQTFEVRIHASNGRWPYARSRPFRLTRHDLHRLAVAALAMESRR